MSRHGSRGTEVQERAGSVVLETIAPIAATVAPGGKLSAEDLRRIYRALRPLGYLGSTVPLTLGGAGLSYVEYGLLLEALGAAPVMMAEIVPPRTINYLGTDEQRRRWLPRLFSGEVISAALITEPQAGSDMRALRTTAVRRGDHYVVNGVKRWIKLGGVADLITLMVTDETGGLSRLVLEHAVSPWESREIETVGIRNLSLAEVTFRDVLVPVENLLGEAGAGGEQFHRGIRGLACFRRHPGSRNGPVCARHRDGLCKGPDRVRAADRAIPGGANSTC